MSVDWMERDEPDEFPCDDCHMDTWWKDIMYHGDDRVCPDCLEKREENE